MFTRENFLNNEIIRRLFSIIILTFIWGLVSYFLDKDILPSPITVAESIKYHSSQELFFHISVTLFRVATYSRNIVKTHGLYKS